MDKEQLLQQAIDNLGKVNVREVQAITSTNTIDRYGNKLLTIKIESGVDKDVDFIQNQESGFMA